MNCVTKAIHEILRLGPSGAARMRERQVRDVARARGAPAGGPAAARSGPHWHAADQAPVPSVLTVPGATPVSHQSWSNCQSTAQPNCVLAAAHRPLMNAHDCNRQPSGLYVEDAALSSVFNNKEIQLPRHAGTAARLAEPSKRAERPRQERRACGRVVNRTPIP